MTDQLLPGIFLFFNAQRSRVWNSKKGKEEVKSTSRELLQKNLVQVAKPVFCTCNPSISLVQAFYAFKVHIPTLTRLSSPNFMQKN